MNENQIGVVDHGCGRLRGLHRSRVRVGKQPGLDGPQAVVGVIPLDDNISDVVGGEHLQMVVDIVLTLDVENVGMGTMTHVIHKCQPCLLQFYIVVDRLRDHVPQPLLCPSHCRHKRLVLVSSKLAIPFQIEGGDYLPEVCGLELLAGSERDTIVMAINPVKDPVIEIILDLLDRGIIQIEVVTQSLDDLLAIMEPNESTRAHRSRVLVAIRLRKRLLMMVIAETIVIIGPAHIKDRRGLGIRRGDLVSLASTFDRSERIDKLQEGNTEDFIGMKLVRMSDNHLDLRGHDEKTCRWVVGDMKSLRKFFVQF